MYFAGKNTLLEISAVPVPANGEALAMRSLGHEVRHVMNVEETEDAYIVTYAKMPAEDAPADGEEAEEVQAAQRARGDLLGGVDFVLEPHLEDLARLSALGPAVFQHQVIALVGVARLQLDGLLTPEPKGLLQLEAHPDVVVLDPIERRAVDLSRLRIRAD